MYALAFADNQNWAAAGVLPDVHTAEPPQQRTSGATTKEMKRSSLFGKYGSGGQWQAPEQVRLLYDPSSKEVDAVSGCAVKLERPPLSYFGLFLLQFLTRVDRLVDDMNTMDALFIQIKKGHSKILAEPGDHSELKARLDSTVQTYTSMLGSTQSALKSEVLFMPYVSLCLSLELHCFQFPQLLGLKADVEKEFGKSTNQTAPTAEARIKRNQVMALTKKFEHLLFGFNEEQLAYRSRCRHKFISYLKISNFTVNDKELDHAIRTASLSEYTKRLMLAEPDKQALYGEVKARHDDILKVEKSIIELYGLVHQLGTLLEEQGEVLDNIERNVGNAAEYANRANLNIDNARSVRASVRKRKICLVIALIVCIIILFGVGTMSFCFYVPFVCR
ncbi:unnamed protein product [Gongylonema pulchrum]|uniref:t-SNARE coiled-coil homology domain-containing protein n=1 Tax=Gongylonema pulchrum TaxID=637853 RepID=A0A183DNH0_9BILA|nr:unnamed protein product [Gongylonema pulchrum]